MTMQWTEAAPVDETLERAKQVSFGRFLTTVWFGFWYAIGWTAGRIWLALVYSVFAIQEGFRDGAGKQRSTPPKHAQRE